MDERELVLTSLIYPLIFREAAQIGIATPIAAHIRELLKIQTLEPEATKIGLARPVGGWVRNVFQNHIQPLEDVTQIGIAKPFSASIKNLFNEYIHQHSDFTQVSNPIPVRMYSKDMLQKLTSWHEDNVVSIGNPDNLAVNSTCKPVVYAPTNLRGYVLDTGIQLYWSNASITHQYQNLYRSETPIDIDNLPPVYDFLFRPVFSYLDTEVQEGVTYFYAVSTIAGEVELLSNIIEIEYVQVSGDCDPFWDNVVSLLHFDDDITDEIGNAWTMAGVANIADDTHKFGGGVLEVPDTSTKSGAYTESSSVFDLSSGDSTLELWVYVRKDSSSSAVLLDITPGAVSQWGNRFVILRAPGGALVVYHDTQASGQILSAGNIPLNQWVHVACVIKNGICSGYINGALAGSGQVTGGMPTGNVRLVLGHAMPAQLGVVNQLRGSIDELRVTKGVARYTENFIPPTKPFPSNDCSNVSPPRGFIAVCAGISGPPSGHYQSMNPYYTEDIPSMYPERITYEGRFGEMLNYFKTDILDAPWAYKERGNVIANLPKTTFPFSLKTSSCIEWYASGSNWSGDQVNVSLSFLDKDQNTLFTLASGKSGSFNTVWTITIDGLTSHIPNNRTYGYGMRLVTFGEDTIYFSGQVNPDSTNLLTLAIPPLKDIAFVSSQGFVTSTHGTIGSAEAYWYHHPNGYVP